MEQASEAIRLRPSTRLRVLRIREQWGGTLDSVVVRALDALDAQRGPQEPRQPSEAVNGVADAK